MTLLHTPVVGEANDKFRHPYYELKGKHKKIACIKCHDDSSAQENTKCIDCHEADIPKKTSCKLCHDQREVKEGEHREKHFGRHCAFCHESGKWQNKISTVAEPEKCITCHKEDVPENHYRINQCFLCHTGASWSQRQFDHEGFENCKKCHIKAVKRKSDQ